MHERKFCYFFTQNIKFSWHVAEWRSQQDVNQINLIRWHKSLRVETKKIYYHPHPVENLQHQQSWGMFASMDIKINCKKKETEKLIHHFFRTSVDFVHWWIAIFCNTVKLFVINRKSLEIYTADASSNDFIIRYFSCWDSWLSEFCVVFIEEFYETERVIYCALE